MKAELAQKNRRKIKFADSFHTHFFHDEYAALSPLLTPRVPPLFSPNLCNLTTQFSLLTLTLTLIRTRTSTLTRALQPTSRALHSSLSWLLTPPLHPTLYSSSLT